MLAIDMVQGQQHDTVTDMELRTSQDSIKTGTVTARQP